MFLEVDGGCAMIAHFLDQFGISSDRPRIRWTIFPLDTMPASCTSPNGSCKHLKEARDAIASHYLVLSARTTLFGYGFPSESQPDQIHLCLLGFMEPVLWPNCHTVPES